MKRTKRITSRTIVLFACIVIFCLLTIFLFIKQGTGVVGSKLSDFFYGCSITPCFQYEGNLYYYASNNPQKESEITNEWQPVATIEVGPADLSDISQDLQANYDKMIGCVILKNSCDSDWLYLKCNGNGYLFISDRCRLSWICLNNNLYLHEAHYNQFLAKQITDSDSNGQDSSILPAHCIFLGNIKFETPYRLPTKNLNTNSADILNYEAYYNPQEDDILYVAVPKGISTQDGLYATRYDKYIKVDLSLVDQTQTHGDDSFGDKGTVLSS